MCFDYDDYPEFTDDRVVKARKRHRCSACRSVIATGEDYHRHSGKYDGEFYVDKVCRRCDYDRVRVVEHELAEGCHWNEAWPSLSDMLDYLHESELGQTPPDQVPEAFNVGDSPREPVAVVESTEV